MATHARIPSPHRLSAERLAQVASPQVSLHLTRFAAWLALGLDPTPQQRAEALATLARGRVERQQALNLDHHDA